MTLARTTITKVSIALLSTLCLHADGPQTCTPPPPGMTAWWPGDGNTLDTAGNHNGTPIGSPMYLPGKVGKAFHLPGNGNHFDFGNVMGNFGTSDFTVDFWVRSARVDFIQAILGKRDVCNYSNFWDFRTNQLPASGFSRITAELGADANNYILLPGTKPVNDGKFHHVAMVRTGTRVDLYFDGQLDATGTTANVIDMSNSASMRAGRSACTARLDGTIPMDGQVDEIELFHRALTSAEVGALFNAGSYGKCKGTTVSIQINRGMDNPNVVVLAILGSATFNANTVIPSSVMLGGYPVKTVPNSIYLCGNGNVNADAFPDRVCAIQTNNAVLPSGLTMVFQGTTQAGPVWGVGILP